MKLLIVYFGPFDVNSAIQAFHFGNELTEMGWDVTLTGRGDPSRMETVGKAHFKCISHGDLSNELRKWKLGGDTAILAWTPRERVRRITLDAARLLDAPYVIHLEDNEEYLLESATGRSLAELERLPIAQQDRLVPIDLIHPTRHREFLAGAAGITVITEALNDFNVAGRPHALARPGIDLERFRPDLAAPSREEIGLKPDDFVLVYHGTIHYANQHEMLSLYLAVKLLNRRGHPVRLVRLGHTEFGGVDPRAFHAVAEGAIELGPVPWREIPNYLALADAFVQPGPPDVFNRYRLPSKLPEFLAMGRPVILPHCNIGNDLTHGQNALLLEEGNAVEIVARVEELLADREMARRLGAGSRQFAVEQLSWRSNAAGLAEFLSSTAADCGRGVGSVSATERMKARAARSPLLRRLAGKAALYAPSQTVHGANASAWVVSESSLWPMAERYAGSFALPPISYGTVSDFADSADNIPGLARASFDMKDVQRCWAIKAVLGNVERGSRILKIGGGGPLVAGVLSRLGYDVTIVDPYDGSDNGPHEFKRFKVAYPDVTMIRERFPPEQPLADDYAAVYSISVMEHIPLDQIETVIGGARELLAKTGGCSIHAIDHVLAGWGAEEHRETLERTVAAHGLPADELEQAIATLEADPDTYFVSAETHNRWRGDLPYDQYPMRRIGSINIFARP